MIENYKSNDIFLRTTALSALLIGTIGSLYFMFIVGGNQKSIILLGLFTAWVISPFAGLFIANRIAMRWTVPARKSLHWFILFLSIAALIAYSGVFTPPQAKPAFIFLIVPLTSWFLIATVFLIGRQISLSGNNDKKI